MKKALSFVLLLVIAISGVIMMSCDNDKNKVKILVPNGITLVAVGGLYDNSDVVIENVDGPDILSAELLKTDYDIIIAPLNLGAKLYNGNQTKFKLDAMITFGNVYIVSKQGADLDNTLENLKGKKLLAFGQNATPGIILRAALDAKGVKPDIDYQNSVNEVVGLFSVDNFQYDYALVAEPVLSQLRLKRNMTLNVIDLQDVLDEMDSIPQAGVFVNSVSKKLGKVDRVLSELKSDIERLNQNPEEYAEEIAEYNDFFKNMTEEIIASAIQSGNVIDYKKAKDNKPVLEAYFQLLIDQNKNLLDKLPEDSFYY